MTHGGVLEFVAAEGTVGLPLKVRRSLGQTDDEQPLGKVKVSSSSSSSSSGSGDGVDEGVS